MHFCVCHMIIWSDCPAMSFVFVCWQGCLSQKFCEYSFIKKSPPCSGYVLRLWAYFWLVTCVMFRTKPAEMPFCNFGDDNFYELALRKIISQRWQIDDGKQSHDGRTNSLLSNFSGQAWKVANFWGQAKSCQLLRPGLKSCQLLRPGLKSCQLLRPGPKSC